MAALSEIVFDCQYPPALARFWAALLDGYDVRPYDDAEIARLAALGLTPETDSTVMVDGPGPKLCFQAAAAASAAENRLHLDVTVTDREAEERRLVALGASVQRRLAQWSVMSDPEGNEFCIVDDKGSDGRT